MKKSETVLEKNIFRIDKIKKMKISVILCTYNREKYLKVYKEIYEQK